MKTKVIVRYLLLGCALALAVPFARGQQQKTRAKYLDPKVAIEDRVTDLLSRMTVEERVAQLQSTLKKIEWGKNFTVNGLGGIGPLLRWSVAKEAAEKANEYQKMAREKTRLGIPIIIHDEALHGLIANGATSFPQAIGLAASWDTDLMANVATAIAKETRSRGIRQVLSPVINIARDVRWGRVEETYGEDPYLQSRLAIEFCKNIEDAGVITTPKHFVANVGDGGRDSYPIHFSERELREVYFPPFKAAFQEANASSVMSAYNAIDGIPSTSSKWLLTEVLRKEWGFKGFVVSDYGSVSGIMDKHHVAATPKEGAAKAVEAGLDVELPDIYFYGEPLLQAARDGSASMKAIDEAARNVLRAKFRLGLFENPYVDPESAASVNDSPDHRALARDAARKAIVLLRNEENTLPLKKEVKSIAVIGPEAEAARLGGYSGFGTKVVTLLDGIKSKVPAAKIVYEKGCDVGFTALPPISSEFLVPADAKPGEHGLRGEYFKNKDLQGPPALVRTDKVINFEWAMGSPEPNIAPDHFSARWTGKLIPKESGTYSVGFSSDDGVRLYIDGKLLIDSWFDRGATLDVVTMKLEAGREYDVKIEYYENEGWAYASFVWDMKRPVDPRIQAAADAAKKSDVAIVAVGIIEGEGYDRSNLDLPGEQEQLIQAVVETKTPTIVVLINGSAVTMRKWVNKVSAIVEVWYPGEEGGNAVADVLFGDFNPGGKLPITFPQAVGQVPLYYNHKPTGRGDDYTDLSGKPLFPFGFGLSYTKFKYSNLQVSPQRINPDGKVQISVDVENTGRRAGDEVVQLYLHDPVASVTRPVKELRGFKRISLAPGEKKAIVFALSKEEMGFLDDALKFVVEPGTIEVMVGSSSDDIRVKSEIEVVK
ncbi:MAG: glycoside hydrolase family 3 C-terminal domain-containing protein [Ignavibacteriales bacterium]|nr:glycoside hydrolase family 3 C-terminal domain-containing protein [Ignavibacteriales bacterium]